MKQHDAAGRFAERELHGVDDDGVDEQIVLWIERKPGALWAVGRSVNAHLRNGGAPRPDEYVFEGYELADALDAANSCLDDDVVVLERDGRASDVKPFTRDEILKPLERWFFGHERS